MFSLFKPNDVPNLWYAAELSKDNQLGGINDAEVIQAQSLHSAVSALSIICSYLRDEGVQCSQMQELINQGWYTFGLVAARYAPDLLRGYDDNISVGQGARAGRVIGEGVLPLRVIKLNCPKDNVVQVRSILSEVGQLTDSITQVSIDLISQRSRFLSDWNCDQALTKIGKYYMPVPEQDLRRLLEDLELIYQRSALSSENARYYLGVLLKTSKPELSDNIINAQLECLKSYRPSPKFEQTLRAAFQAVCRDNFDLLMEVRELWPKLDIDSKMDFLRYWIDITRVHLPENMQPIPVKYNIEVEDNTAGYFVPIYNTGISGYIEFNQKLLEKMTFDQAIQVASHELAHAYTFHLMANKPFDYSDDMEWLLLSVKLHDYIQNNTHASRYDKFLSKKYLICPHEILSFGIQDVVAGFLLDLGVIKELTQFENLLSK